MSFSKAPFKVPEKEITEWFDTVSNIMTVVKWKPEKAKQQPIDSKKNARSIILSNMVEQMEQAKGSMDEKRLLTIFAQIDGNKKVASEEINFLSNTIQRGISIGGCVFDTYQKVSGAKDLSDRGGPDEKGLSQTQKDELHKKKSTASAIFLFVSASYIVWKLSSYNAKKLDGIVLPQVETPNLHLTDEVIAMRCMLYYFGLYIDPSKGGVARTPSELIKFTIQYFQLVVDDIKERKQGLQYLDFFTGNTYQPEEEKEFVIDGFEPSSFQSIQVLDIVPVKLEDIVGNEDVKLQCKRLVQRLMMYDIAEGENPFMEKVLGGFPDIAAGYGPPGTGKSMLIAAMAGMMKDYAEKLGIPFQFAPLPGNIISTFQGGSAERAIEWFKTINNPRCITFAPIDDAENVMQDRTMQGVSSGVREFIGEFLRSTEGASAIKRGQLIIYLMTNLLEQVDPAILSRIKSRAYIAGAVTGKDWIDQDYLWWKNHQKGDEAIVNLIVPKNYEFMASQKNFKSFADSKFNEESITDPDLKSLVLSVKKKYNGETSSIEFYGELFSSGQKIYPFITSRESRNIQSTVDFRLMDFDIPEEWLTNPDTCIRKPYKEKVSMLLALKKEDMNGLSFAQIKYQETIRHLDTLVNEKNPSRRRSIEALAEEMLLQEEARKLVVERKKITGQNDEK